MATKKASKPKILKFADPNPKVYTWTRAQEESAKVQIQHGIAYRVIIASVNGVPPHELSLDMFKAGQAAIKRIVEQLGYGVLAYRNGLNIAGRGVINRALRSSKLEFRISG